MTIDEKCTEHPSFGTIQLYRTTSTPGAKMSKEVLDVGFAVFNMSNDDKKLADAGFIRRFGQEAFGTEIEPLHKNGIMTIFHESPTEYTKWYAEAVAFLVNKRRAGA